VLTATPRGKARRLLWWWDQITTPLSRETKRARADAQTLFKPTPWDSHAVLPRVKQFPRAADDLIIALAITPLISSATFDRLRAP